jgi:hypothetical protein
LAVGWVHHAVAYKENGIVNDANLWATETMDNARFPLEIFQSVITVSLEAIKIVNALPLWILHNEYDVIDVGAHACCALNLPNIPYVPLWIQRIVWAQRAGAPTVDLSDNPWAQQACAPTVEIYPMVLGAKKRAE